MIMRRSPTNINDFIAVKSELSMKLCELGFIPKYMDNEWIYFVKNEKLSEAIVDLERSKLLNG